MLTCPHEIVGLHAVSSHLHWETASCPPGARMDSIGSDMALGPSAVQVMRIVPVQNDAVNEEWISDKARFQYDGLKRQRLNVPLVKGPEARGALLNPNQRSMAGPAHAHPHARASPCTCRGCSTAAALQELWRACPCAVQCVQHKRVVHWLWACLMGLKPALGHFGGEQWCWRG